MTAKLTAPRLFAAAVIVLSAWIVHDFAEALVAACVTAIASWPLYTRYMASVPRCLANRAGSVIFTGAITVFVLAPMVFACVALLGQAHSLLRDIAAAGGHGLAVPRWLASLPVARPWLSTRGQLQPASSNAVLMLTQHADPGTLLGWAQSLGQFTLRNGLIVALTVLLLAFFYQEGESLAYEFTAVLRQAIGERVERYVEVGTRALRSSVNSMLIVGLFDGLASGLAYTAAGVPRPLLWAVITGVLAAIPFLGYVAVGAVALQLAVEGAPTTALLALLLGCIVLLLGDKLVRPMVACSGMRLPFVWVLMGSIGGFGALGLTGIVTGPVVLTLALELWVQRARAGE